MLRNPTLHDGKQRLNAENENKRDGEREKARKSEKKREISKKVNEQKNHPCESLEDGCVAVSLCVAFTKRPPTAFSSPLRSPDPMPMNLNGERLSVAASAEQMCRCADFEPHAS